MNKKKTELSERQKEVMELVVKGYTPFSIAQQLCISESCAKLHMQAIYRKLGFEYEKGRDMKVRAIIKYLKVDEFETKYTALAKQYKRLQKEYDYIKRQYQFVIERKDALEENFN